MNRQELKAALSLAAIYALRMFGLFAILPVLSIEAASFPDASPSAIGLAIGVYGATQAILQLPMGMLSDKIGRKPVIIAGLLVFAIGSWVAASATTLHWLIIGRSIQGAGAISASVLALAADLTRVEQRSKVMAIIGISIGASFVLAIMLGPVIVAGFGLSGLFYLIVMLSLVAMLLVWRVVPTPVFSGFHSDTSFNRAMLGRVATDMNLWRMIFAVLVLHLTMTSFFMLVPPLLLSKIGLAKTAIWKLLVPAVIIGFFLIARQLRHSELSGTRIRLVLGVVMLALSVALILPALQTQQYWVVLLVMIGFFAAFNYLEATLPSLVSQFAPPAGRGTAMALFAMGQFLGAFLGGVVAGRVQEYTSNAVMTILLIIGLLVMTLWALWTLRVQTDYRTEMFSVSECVQQERINLVNKIKNIRGVMEVVIPEDEATAYIRVDNTKLDREALIQLLA